MEIMIKKHFTGEKLDMKKEELAKQIIENTEKIDCQEDCIKILGKKLDNVVCRTEFYWVMGGLVVIMLAGFAGMFQLLGTIIGKLH
jgi:hypothetical protein